MHLLASLGRSERRSSLRLYKHWDAARNGAALPKLPDFDLTLLQELGASCFLMITEPGEGAPAFRYFGRNLAFEIGRDLTGRPISEAPASSLLSRVLGHYLEAMQQHKPVGINGRFEAATGRHLLYRGILLPFSSQKGQVNAILGCYRSRQALRSEQPAVAAVEASPLVLGPDELQDGCRPGKLQALKSLARQIALPDRALSSVRAAPPMGKAVVRLDEPASEFVLMLGRRADGDAGRFEVVSVAGPVLLNLALRHAASRLLRPRR
jgi:hypothetical protein